MSIMSEGSIRTDLYEGNFTYRNIGDILPFFNDIIVKEVTGQNILDAIIWNEKFTSKISKILPSFRN